MVLHQRAAELEGVLAAARATSSRKHRASAVRYSTPRHEYRARRVGVARVTPTRDGGGSDSHRAHGEVARAAGKDSLEFRRALMQNHPKHLAVLNAAAEKGDWGKPLPAGVHRHRAVHGLRQLLRRHREVSVDKDGKVKVHRMVLALNCGHAVNPQQIAAQVEGSVVYGLSAAFYGEITIENGRVAQSTSTTPPLRLADMPKVETVLVPTYDFWGGVGERPSA